MVQLTQLYGMPFAPKDRPILAWCDHERIPFEFHAKPRYATTLSVRLRWED